MLSFYYTFIDGIEADREIPPIFSPSALTLLTLEGRHGSGVGVSSSAPGLLSLHATPALYVHFHGHFPQSRFQFPPYLSLP